MYSVSFVQELLDRNLLLNKSELDQLCLYAQKHKPKAGHTLKHIVQELPRNTRIPFDEVKYNSNVELKLLPMVL